MKPYNNLAKTLHELSPSKHGLLSMISDLISEEMLQKIANADYGYEADSCFVELMKIKKTGEAPSKIEYTLQEVLELTRWTAPQTNEEHIIRLFCCINLIILYPILPLQVGDENETIAVFIESILRSGKKYYQPSLQLISWRILNDYRDELKFLEEDDDMDLDDVYLAPVCLYALLLLMILSNKPEKEILQIQQWITNSQEQPANIDIIIESIESGQRKEVWKNISESVKKIV